MVPTARPHLPLWGDLVWLTHDQGGRESGPPPTPWDTYYVATAFVPPSASAAPIVLDVAVRDAWTSRAKAGWLAPPGPALGEGSVLMIAEGSRTVAVFTVTHVERPSDVGTQPRPPMSAGDLASIEARARAATAGPWRAMVEGRDHLAGESFVLARTAAGDQIDLSVAWAPLVEETQRAADLDFIARARQDVPDMVAEIRELRAWQGLEDHDAGHAYEAATDVSGQRRHPDVVYVVQTDPSSPETVQLGAFTRWRDALEALREARVDRPGEDWGINVIRVWERFTDYRAGR